MNISKFLDGFYLINKIGKNGKPYYAITMRFGGFDHILCFVSKSRFDELSKLSK